MFIILLLESGGFPLPASFLISKWWTYLWKYYPAIHEKKKL